MTKRIIFLATSFTFFVHMLNAATVQSNVLTGNWNTGSTWVGNTVPNSNDDVVINIGHTITIDDIMTSVSCKSLTVNGKVIYNSNADFSIGNFNDRTAACLINGVFEYSTGYGFKIYGYLKFNTGSTFTMTSGGLTIDGTLGSSTSVATGQAHLDVLNIGTLNATGGTIGLRNPHYDGVTPCIAGAKTFGNTIAFGAGNTTDTNNDFLISETDKPQFNNVEINYYSGTSRFKATDISINGAISILAGTLYNYSSATTIRIKGDFNVKQGVTITGNIEFNGTGQQNINPQYGSGATLVTFNGNLIVNNPTEIKSKITPTITGDLIFIQGKFDTEAKLLTLERTPLGTSSSSYIITYNFYHDIGTVLIQNLSGNTLFPIGTSYSYTPVWVNAASGNFKASVTPLLISAPSGLDAVNLQWNVQRVFGPPTADMTVQWNASDEMTPFTTSRSYCSLFHYNSLTTTWESATNTGGAVQNGAAYTKTATAVGSFSPFAMFTSTTLPIDITQFTGKNIGNAVQLSWTTAAEKNNLGFQIEKNTEGGTPTAIGFVKSQGNAQTPTDYTFLDTDFTQTAYYRLKQTDRDGHSTYSKVIAVENAPTHAVAKAFPNPILRGSLLTIELAADKASAAAAAVVVYNVNGQKVEEQRGLAPIQTDNWQAGIYVVKIVDKHHVSTLKVVKQ